VDDKWFIYAEGLVVYFCRSWTGHCIYKVRFEKVGGKYRVAEAMVNRDASQYSQIDDGYDARLLHFIIRGILLGESVAFPMAPLKNSEACAQEVYQHHVAGAAVGAQFRPSLLRRVLRRVCGR